MIRAGSEEACNRRDCQKVRNAGSDNVLAGPFCARSMTFKPRHWIRLQRKLDEPGRWKEDLPCMYCRWFF